MKKHLNATPEEIEKLAALEAVENNGRGIQCVKSIIFSLQRGERDEARAVREWDGDKTRSYPLVEAQLTKMFGCRSHGVENCQNPMCRPN